MDIIYYLCSVLTLFIICSKLSSAAETKLTKEFIFDHLSRRLDNLAFEIHAFRMDSQKRMEEMDTKIKDNIPLQKPVSSEILDQGQIQRQIKQEMVEHANVFHRMLSAEKKAMHNMREQFSNQWKNFSLDEHRIPSINKTCADLRTDFDGFEDAINTKVGDLNIKLDSLERNTIKGEKGEPGQSGSERYAGKRGPPGLPGVPGRKGDKGDEGSPHKLTKTPLSGRYRVVGRPGLPGVPGRDGERGETGMPGIPGRDGLAGPPGVKGEPGPKGPTGNTGPKGDTGVDGRPGIQGPKGDTGQKGDKGDEGSPHIINYRKGHSGVRGLKEDKGDKGSSDSKGEMFGRLGNRYGITPRRN